MRPVAAGLAAENLTYTSNSGGFTLTVAASGIYQLAELRQYPPYIVPVCSPEEVHSTLQLSEKVLNFMMASQGVTDGMLRTTPLIILLKNDMNVSRGVWPKSAIPISRWVELEGMARPMLRAAPLHTHPHTEVPPMPMSRPAATSPHRPCTSLAGQSTHPYMMALQHAARRLV